MKIAILTVSDSRTLADDRSGSFLLEAVTNGGHSVAERIILPDDRYRVRAAIAGWIADDSVEVVIATGGTGFTGRDITPEAVLPLLDKVMEGFGELFRSLSFEEIGTSAIQSRAMAGVANGTIVFCLPGSTGACRTAWDRIIRAQLDSETKPCNMATLAPRFRES
jgi:molybdenum cofactor biosynthesis protein B